MQQGSEPIEGSESSKPPISRKRAQLPGTLRPSYVLQKTKPRQYTAVFNKNVAILKKSWCCTFWQFLFLALLMVGVVALHRQLIGDGAPVPPSQISPSRFSANLDDTYVAQTLYTPPVGVNLGFLTNSTVNGGGFLGTIAWNNTDEGANDNYHHDEPSTTAGYEHFYIPSFSEVGSADEMDEILYNAEELVHTEDPGKDDPTQVIYYTPTGSVDFHDVSWVSNPLYDYTLQIFRQNQSIVSAQDNTRIHDYQNFLYMAFIRSMFSGEEVPTDDESGKNTWVIDSGMQGLWYIKYGEVSQDTFTEAIGLVVYPLCLTILVPGFIYAIVAEKTSQIKALNQMMGLKGAPRMLADYTWQLIHALIAAVIVGLVGFFGELALFSDQTPVAWILSLLALALAVPILAAFVSAFFESARLAALFGVVLILTITIGLSLVGFGHGVVGHMPLWANLLPAYDPMAAMIELSLCAMEMSTDYVIKASNLHIFGHYSSPADVAGQRVCLNLVFGLISGVVYFFLAGYFEAIMPRSFGVPSHPLFFAEGLVRRAAAVRAALASLGVAQVPRNQSLTLGAVFSAIGVFIAHPILFARAQQLVEEEATLPAVQYGSSQRSEPSISSLGDMRAGDIAEERERAERGLSSTGREALVRVLGLRKVYPGTRLSNPKEAVKGVWFTVAEGECLGMLGPNGAGKTTTVSMLCGLFAPTSGTARIVGHDMSQPGNLERIQAVMGVCPQFDVHWPSLTCKEHLSFYCKLKGVGPDVEEQHIEDLLEAVDLIPQRDVPSSSLSGGMRRRLSVAVALAGKPRVLYLDEPTTGLDPRTRRQLWNIILAVRPGRAILLTTHSMEEAEALCSRIGIMAAGRLRCIGTSSALKTRFGKGYKLTVCVDMDAQQKQRSLAHSRSTFTAAGEEPSVSPVCVGGIMLMSSCEQKAHQQLMNSLGHELRLSSAYTGTLTYVMPQSMARNRISSIFGTMEGMLHTDESCICDWGISQSSLESVFLHVVQMSS
eukprot:gnl/Dysnectes_brevis/129_a152_4397.p1 GENE.gnl/Dysnectes_brevis/129_a152_4397~~gnl/Dysnectes_brevis/129_a152_4397.p1  ORF type:complete len:1000 (-),score=354.61 gnl/Dysnectes_brevis/129_a152_4397:155-3154(-)